MEKNKNIDKSGQPILTPEAEAAFSTFVQLVSLKWLNRSIRHMFLYYMHHEHDKDLLIEDNIKSIGLLLELLDQLQDIYEQPKL